MSFEESFGSTGKWHPNKDLALEHFQKAYEFQMKGKLEEAVFNYRKSIELYPTAEAHTFLGWAYSFQGRHDDAISECKRAIEIDPDFGNPYNDIGAYLIEKGQPEDAIPWLEKAVCAKRYESYCYPHYNLGRVYEQKGKWFDALRCYENSVKANPDYTLATRAISRIKAFLN